MLKKITIRTTADQADAVVDFLEAYGALSVSLQDAGDQPLFQIIPNEAPLWKNTQIQALFDESVPLDALLSVIDSVESVEEENWVEKTQRNFQPQQYDDRLWIWPAWMEPPTDSKAVVIRLNPGLGFGTGSHPTTALCLKWLARQEVSNKIVVDYGCGSGILALAARALGAKEVWAVDHDPQALMATKENAALNHFSDSALHIVSDKDLPNTLAADIILANILANPLCELSPRLIGLMATGGALALSGFLFEEKDRILRAYQPPLELIKTESAFSGPRENWQLAVFKSNH